MVAIQEKAQASKFTSMQQAEDAKLKAQIAIAQLSDKALDRQSRERLAEMKIDLEKIRLVDAQITHSKEADLSAAESQNEMMITQLERLADMKMRSHEKAQEHQHAEMEQSRAYQEAERMHAQRIRHLENEHTRKLEFQQQQSDAKVAQIKAQAAAKPKPAKKGK